MPQLKPLPHISEEEYIQGEEAASTRHDYIDGRVYDIDNYDAYGMAGTSARHNLIAVNAGSLLSSRLPDDCEVFVSDMKVRIQRERAVIFFYPDALVSCAADDRADYYRAKPCLIIEVLSPSTERQDRFEKFWSYQQIPSLQEYLLLSQQQPEAVLFRRADGWQPEIYSEGTLFLASVNLEMPLDALYRRVHFD